MKENMSKGSFYPARVSFVYKEINYEEWTRTQDIIFITTFLET